MTCPIKIFILKLDTKKLQTLKLFLVHYEI